jgi:Fic family protein
MGYIYDRLEWPYLTWDNAKLLPLLAAVRHRQGRLLGRMEILGFQLRAEVNLTTLTFDVLKSSLIEGDLLDAGQVRSSIARRLGLDVGGVANSSRVVEGVVEMMLDATQKYSEPLTIERLFNWHASLFPTGRSGMGRITVGAWRTAEADPMQVVSGPMGSERVHFEAPPAYRLQHEATLFLDWFEAANEIDPVLKAGIAHFWFVTLHPFEDGNGRIHRYLIHHLLASKKYVPKGIIFPVSAIILERLDEYRTSLESYSMPRLDLIEWKITPKNNVEVVNDTIDLYRYFDATKQVEFLYSCVQQTAEKTITEEVNYLKKYDAFKLFLEDNYEMPDKTIALLVRFLEQNNGKFSDRAKSKEFHELKISELREIQKKYADIFN